MPPFPHLFQFISSSSPTTTKRRPPLSPRGLMNDLPTELILTILRHLALRDILTLTLIHHQRLYPLCLQVLAEILSQPELARLRLFFDQESRWQSTIDMTLASFSSCSPSTPPKKFIFKPVHTNICFRGYSSLLLRRPTLYRIAIIDYANNVAVVENVLARSTSVDVKRIQLSTLVVDNDVSASFRYRVHATPPSQIKQRPGERWIQPVELSCHPWWICQRKTHLMRFIESIPCSAGLVLFSHHTNHPNTINKFLAKTQDVPIVGHGMVLAPSSKDLSPAPSSSRPTTPYLDIAAPS